MPAGGPRRRVGYQELKATLADPNADEHESTGYSTSRAVDGDISIGTSRSWSSCETALIRL